MQVYTGTYVGDGNDDRWINDPGFQPDLVVIKGDTTEYMVWRSSTMDAGDSAYFGAYGANFANAIQAFGANGFQIGTDGTVNTNGVNYYYFCVRDDGAGDFHVGTYTGDGNDDRSITSCGFDPTCVWTKADATGTQAWFRFYENSGDSAPGGTAANTADRVQAFVTDGFQVGASSQVNENGTVYHYVAFKDITGFFDTGTYTGDGNDDRSISVGWQPDVVWVKSGSDFDYAILAIDTMPVGDSGEINNTALVTNNIQAFEVNGFQIGTDDSVNEDTDTFYYFALLEGSSGGVVVRRRRIEGY